MAKALSVDLRHRVVAAIAEGMSRRQAAARFGVSAASAVRWHQRFKASGTVAPSRQGGDRRSGRIEAYSEVILGLVTETPDMTLAELRERLKERRVSAGIGTLWRFFKRRRITLKKKTAHAAEQQRSDVRVTRTAWFDGQLDLDPEKLIHRRDRHNHQDGAPLWQSTPWQALPRRHPSRPLEDHHSNGRLADRRARSTHGDGWSHAW